MTNGLGHFEQIVLMAVMRAGDGAYGVRISEEIEMGTGASPSRGALYTTLDRLEAKGMLKSRMGDPTPQRGGRAKRFYTVTREGLRLLADAQRSYRRLAHGLKLLEVE